MGNKIDQEARRLFEQQAALLPVDDKDREAPGKRPKAKPELLDLHGYSLEKALSLLQKFLNESQQKKFRELTVITGQARHSAQAIPVLKNGVQELLDDRQQLGRLTYHYHQGVFRICLL